MALVALRTGASLARIARGASQVGRAVRTTAALTGAAQAIRDALGTTSSASRSVSRGRSTTRRPPPSMSSGASARSNLRRVIGSRPISSSTTTSGNNSNRIAPVCGKPAKVLKSKKVVKVSRKFRKLVKAASTDILPRGTYLTDTHIVLKDHEGDNLQSCDNRGFNALNAALVSADGAPFFDFFTPERVLDAASVLFNAKAVNQQFAITTNNFARPGLVINVKRQFVRIYFRNNTQVPKSIILYICVPKQDSNVTGLQCFTNCLAADFADGLAVRNHSVTEHGVNPGLSKKFNQAYRYTAKQVTLMPGQTSTTFTVQGPQGDYAYDNFFDDNTDVAYPKHRAASCFYIVKNVEVLAAGGGAEAGVGIYNETYANWGADGFKVTASIEHFYDIVAPEKTTVSLRVKRYGTIVFNPCVMTSADSLLRLDPITPVVPEASAGQHGAGTGPLGI